MTRTQIYLPEDLHQDLMAIAHLNNTSLSQLLREGAKSTIKKYSHKRKPKDVDKGLSFFANPPKEYLIHSKQSAVDLVRADRD